MTSRQRALFIALSPLAAILLAGAAILLAGKHCFAERVRQAAACGTKEQCDRFFGPPVYDCATDDTDGARNIERICRGQAIFPAKTAFPALPGSSVAFYDPGCRLAVPKKFIFVQYDRKSGRIVRRGWVGV